MAQSGGYYGGHTTHAPPPQQGQMPHPAQQFHQRQPPPQQFQQMNVQQNPHYGGYQQTHATNVFEAQAWQAMEFRQESDLRGLFDSKINQTLGGIQGQELNEILNQNETIRRYYGISWSLELCKIMLAMMDRDKNGIMKWQEFTELLNCLVYWRKTFGVYDQDRSGYIEAHELGRVIRDCYKYRLSQQTMTTLLKRYSRVLVQGHDQKCLIAFDDFVALSVRLRAYTEAFRQRDRMVHGGQETGNTDFQYDDFLQCVMCL